MANNFQKFIRTEDKGAKLKEKIRQEKKKVRKETKEFFENRKKQSRGRGEEENYTPANSRNTSGAAGNTRTSQKNASGSAKNSRQNPRDTSRSPRNTRANPGTTSASPAKAPENPANTSVSRKTRLAVQKKGNSLPQQGRESKPAASDATQMPLNKFVAHAGICSRRDAAGLVRTGKVTVNGTVVSEPGFKVSRQDDVRVQGTKVSATRSFVYILLNKPKDHITTMEDPQGRKTVMDIVKKATPERVYPVGRLDRNTTGVLLLTNDGELAQKLSHPSYEVRKIYEVTLDRPLAKKDFDELVNGVTLEDGFIAPDSLAYADSRDRSIIGIEIHSGKNRIVRRIFEKLGYDVRNLDRVMYANLTKKNVERGKWRFLQEKEVRLLKFMNASYGKKKAQK